MAEPQGGKYTHGMDVERVRDIASRLGQAQRELSAARNASDDAVRLLREQWSGEDSAAFAKRWPHLQGVLDTQVGELKSLVRALQTHVTDQERASGIRGGGGGQDGQDGPGGPGGPKAPDGLGRGGPRQPDLDGPGLEGQDTPNRTEETTDTSPRHRDNSNTTRTDTETRYTSDDGLARERGHRWETTWTRTDADGDGTPDSIEDNDGDGTPDSQEGEHRAEQRGPTTEVKGILWEDEKELWEASYSSHTLGDEKGNHAKVDFLSTEGKAEGEVSIGRDGLAAAGTVTAAAYLAHASGQYSTSFGTQAKGEAYVGGEANANAGVSLGTDGLKASAGGEAFVGGKAEAQIAQDLGPVDVGVGGEISYGVGVHAEGDVAFSTDEVGVSLDIGATLGIGGGVSVDVGFDPTFWN
jgi:hypothetical protein